MDNYEKKYKEALEKAKEWEKRYILTNTISPDGTMAKEFKEIFSKLTESEDEKTRKDLIDTIHHAASSDVHISEELEQRYLAYLERQKERGPLTKEEERTLQGIILHLEDEGCPTKWKDLLHNIYNLPYTKQEEQKQIKWTELTWKDIVELEGIINNVHYNFSAGIGQESFGKEVLERFRSKKDDVEVDACGQKPAEWDEEDETHRAFILESLEDQIRSCKKDAKGAYYAKQIQTAQNWLKSLPERFNLQSKQEWSEENENKLNHILEIVHIASGTEASVDEKEELESFLKSLRPQPRKEIYQAVKHDLAIKFMNHLDENRPEGKMSLSNGECEDIDKAFKENNWATILKYAEKYSPSWRPSEEQIYSLGTVVKGYDECTVGSIGYNLKELYEQLKKL